MSGIEAQADLAGVREAVPAVRRSSSQVSSGNASNKIHPRHHDRLAVVYVRQSSPHQVREHRESTALQYGLADRAVTLGRPGSRVVMYAGTFDMPTISRSGRVIHPQQDSIAEPWSKLLHEKTEYRRGQLS